MYKKLCTRRPVDSDQQQAKMVSWFKFEHLCGSSKVGIFLAAVMLVLEAVETGSTASDKLDPYELRIKKSEIYSMIILVLFAISYHDEVPAPNMILKGGRSRIGWYQSRSSGITTTCAPNPYTNMLSAGNMTLQALRSS